MKKLFGLVILVVLVLVAFLYFHGHSSAPAPASPETVDTTNPAAVPAGTPVDVGLIQLLQNGAAYDGRLVRVSGYMHAQPNDSAIYLRPDVTETANALWVEVPAGQPNGNAHFISCEGIFSAANHGSTGAFGGGLKVTKLHMVP